MSATERVSWPPAGLFIVLICLACPSSSHSAERYRVRNWQADEGLPQNSVWAITQTPDGYLWIGTQQGLVRFDGVRFLPIDESAPTELRRGFITALCLGHDESLWIGTDNSGIWKLDQGQLTHFGENEGLANNKIHHLLEGRDGSLWIATENGLSHLSEGKLSTLTTKSGLPHNSVRGLCEDRQGNIRAATGRGLCTINAQGVTRVQNFGTGTTPNSLKGVCLDQHGRIWVTSPEGVTCEEATGQRFFGVKDGLPSPIATFVMADGRAGVWAGTYNGVVCIREEKVAATPLNEAGFGDLINTIYEDREENVWIGARDGLYRVSPARFTAFRVQEGLACNNVMSVLQDKSGAMWFATWGGGLNELRDETFKVYGATNGLTHDKVLALCEGHDGLWVGMDNGRGLNRLQGCATNCFPKVAGLFDTAIRVIHEDRHGVVWIGTHAGLHVYNKGDFTTYTTDNGLAGNLVLVIFEDRSGTIWVGTDEGLSRRENGKFINYRAPENSPAAGSGRDALSQNTIQTIYQDAEGALWIGTRKGLNRFSNGKFRNYTSRQGMFSDDIYEILEDDSGSFWMSCRSGIFRVARRDFELLDRGAIQSLTCTAFGRSDGLPTVQCNGIAKPGGWKSRDGRLWFPTIRGIVAVEPGVKTNDRPPPVRIEEVIADRKYVRPACSILASAKRLKISQASISPSGNTGDIAIEIPAGHGDIEVHYTALSLQAPEKNRFKYRLEPVDADWMDAATRREVFYANVGPGSYRFHVIACNNDGVWNENEATLALIILPHFYQTLWFKLALIIAVLLLLAGYYQLRLARLRDIEALRVQIAADLHDDVGARLTKVAMVTELVDRETPEQDRNKPQITNIVRTTGEVIRAMDEIVWTINPSNDTVDNLANYLFQHAQEYFQNTGVRCRMDFPAKLPDYTISTEARHNIFMAFKEALNNVLKHARATEVRIGLATDNGKLTIQITDNGSGFFVGQEAAGGDGLRNMRHRLQEIRGKLRLESAPGSGTKVQMEIRAG